MSINEDSDIDNKRIVNYIVVAVLVVALLALNWCSLKKYLSSSSGTINDFQISESEMTKPENLPLPEFFTLPNSASWTARSSTIFLRKSGREPRAQKF